MVFGSSPTKEWDAGHAAERSNSECIQQKKKESRKIFAD